MELTALQKGKNPLQIMTYGDTMPANVFDP